MTAPNEVLLPDDAARRIALTDFQNNVVVTAGAGTGKTSLLVGRLVAALVIHRFEPQQVLAVTFTENAAAEMRERLIRVLASVRPFVESGGADDAIEASDAYILARLGLGPEDLGRVDDLLDQVETLVISTFHGFCLSFLREHARRLELPPDLGVANTGNQHPGFEEVFLEYLREASEGDVHEALHRFDPTELHDLALECIELPEDSLDRTASKSLPDGLGERLEDLRTLVADHPKALANWHAAAADFAACYEALIEGEQPRSDWIPKATPAAGKRQFGDRAEGITDALKAHHKFLTPWVTSDQEGIAIAVDFIKPILQRFRRRIATRGELGFQDLLLLTRQSLRTDDALRHEMNRRLRCILVDEFQDTDPLQYDVVFLIAAEETASAPIEDPMELPLRAGSLFIVGDAKQSIYRFRRADVAAFSRAVHCIDQQGGRRVDLTANFRSRPPILDFVNSVCASSLAEKRPYQFGYTPVVPMLGGDDRPVQLLEVDSETELRSDDRRRHEGNIVVERIAALHTAGRSYGDIAILLRATTDTSWILRPLRAAGIPYVLEGSRRFYQRQEVILCRALLSALAQPHDPVAVLAVLRSSLSSASDAEIVAYLESGRSLDFRAGRGPGPIGACLDFLRTLHAKVIELPIDEALTHVLTLPEIRLSEGSGFEGAQRLANIERLLQRMLRRDPIDLGDAASTLAQATDLETDDEESPLFDGGVSAVRLLTVHRAKGLEFPIVFVPDLARHSAYREKLGRAQAQRLFDEDGIEVVPMRIGETRNVASLLNKDAGRLHDEAEQRRLFYVAATRAKEQLFLIRGESVGRRWAMWQDDVDSGSAPHERTLVVGTAPKRENTSEEFDPRPTIAAHAAHQELVARLGATVPAPDVKPSEKVTTPRTATKATQQLTFDFVAAPKSESDVPTPVIARTEAMEIGTAMHEYLSLVDFSSDGVDEDLLDQLPHAAAIREMAESFHASKLRERLQHATSVRREIPLTFLEDEAIVHGVVDLLFEEPDGTATVLDWKTDRLDLTAAEERAETYRNQLEVYGRGVQSALDHEARPRIAVHFLRADQTIELGSLP